MNTPATARPDLSQLRLDRDAPKPPAAGGRRIKLVVAVVLVLVALAALFAWRAAATVPVKTEVAVRQAASASATVLDASGYVTARRQATVSAKRTGKVREVMIEEGQHVKEGQVLATLDDAAERAQYELGNAQLAAARANVEETRAQLVEAKLRFERNQRLHAEKLVSTADLDNARALADSLAARLATQERNVEVATRALGVQREALDETQIRAPFDGVVVAKTAQPGEMISPVSAGGGFTRTGICTLVDMRSLEVEVDVNEAYIQRVTAGQKLTARLDAYPDWEVPAEVIAIIPTADRQKATVKVRVKLLVDDPRVLPDMGVKVAFLEESKPQAAAVPAAVTVPQAALRGAGAEAYVLVVEGGVAHKRLVSVAAGGSGGAVRVTAGLAGGERVVTDGPPDLADGQRVKVL